MTERNFLIKVYEKRVKGSIPINVPTAKKTFYVVIEPKDEAVEFTKKEKNNIAYLIAYCLDNSYTRCAKIDDDNQTVLYLVETAPLDDDTVFASFSASILELDDVEDVENELTTFFTGEAKTIADESWKELKKKYASSPIKIIATVLVFMFLMWMGYSVFFSGGQKTTLPTLPRRKPPPPNLTADELDKLLRYMTKKVFVEIAKLTRENDPRFTYIESLNVKPVYSVRYDKESGYKITGIAKYLFPVDNSKLSTCGKYPCWKKFIDRKVIIKNLDFRKIENTIPKLTKEQKEKCYKDFALKYVVKQVEDKTAVYSPFPVDVDKPVKMLIQLQKDYQVCPFKIKSLQINNGKIDFLIEL